MTLWRKDGMPIDEQSLAELALRDGDVLCEYAGTPFRLTAETVALRSSGPTSRRGGTVVLTMRQLDAGKPGRGVHLVDFAHVDGLAAVACRGECPLLDEADRAATLVARRYVAAGLFHQVQEMISAEQVA